jgi:hypothetical protein
MKVGLGFVQMLFDDQGDFKASDVVAMALDR